MIARAAYGLFLALQMRYSLAATEFPNVPACLDGTVVHSLEVGLIEKLAQLS